MATDLEVQPVFDSRLMVENPSQIVTLGANQTIMRNYPASTVTASSIAFNNILQVGSGVLIDNKAWVEYDLAVVVTTATIAASNFRFPGVNAAYTAISAISVADGANVPNVGFAQYPLHSNAQNAQITINNVSMGFTCNQLFAVIKEWVLDENQRKNISSSCPSENSSGAISQASAQNAIVPDQPLTPAYACKGRSRVSYQPLSVVVPAGGTTTIITYRIREPVMVPPFGLYSSPALGNVQSIGLNYNIDSANGLRGMLCSSVTASNLVAGGLVSITPISANLYLTFLTPDLAVNPIPPLCSYSYSFPEQQLTTISNALDGTSRTAVGSLTTTAQRLTTIPNLYGLKLAYNVLGRNEFTSNGAGLAILNCQINYGNYGTYQFDRLQLWQLFNKNAPNAGLTFQNWVNMGCPVLINPTEDLTGANVFAGMSDGASLMWSNQITYTAENYVDFGGFAGANVPTPATQFFAYEVFLQNGSVSIGGGSAVFKQTSASQAAVVSSLQSKDAVSDEAIKASDPLNGKGLFSTLKSVFHHAKKHAGTVAKMLPVAQAGLEALAGSGASGGAMAYRRRR